MQFSSNAVAEVYGEFERRRREEQQRMATLGSAVGAHLDEFLLPVGPEVGWFLYSLILARRPARVLELGTSYGYSSLFLADAVKQVGGRLITMDLADFKQDYARERLERAGIADVVDFRLGDAIAMIDADEGPFELVLLDIWKDVYVPCFEAFYPKLPEGGIVAADNMIEPVGAREDARRYRAAVAAKPDLTSTLLAIGNGIELSTRWPAGSHAL